jgi:nucleotide-binding universal stress UspA family protein
MYWSETPNLVEYERAAHRRAEEYLRSIHDLHASPRLAISTKVGGDDVASTIVDTAEAQEVELIVMSTRGRAALSRWMLGSVTERVLHSAPCPVLTLRANTPLRHMLITVDGSPLAERVLEPALTTAERLHCDVTLFYVEQPLDYSPSYVNELEHAEAGLGEQYLLDLSNRAHLYLEQLTIRLKPYGLPIKSVLTSGPVANNILDYAENHEVDVIAMCTHGRTGLQRWVYGSVTEKVLRYSRCAMLIVRPWY